MNSFDVESRYALTSSLMEIKSFLEHARENSYNCLVSSYTASLSQLQIYLWLDEYGVGSVLIARECSFIKGHLRWEKCNLKIELQEYENERRFVLMDSDAEVEVHCYTVMLAKDVEF